MRHRTRHVIAVMVVATALCADRAVAAAPARTAPSRSLASRITTGLRQQVTRTYLVPARTSEQVTSIRLPISATASGVRSDFSPFQFRLPPPATR